MNLGLLFQGALGGVGTAAWRGHELVGSGEDVLELAWLLAGLDAEKIAGNRQVLRGGEVVFVGW